MKFFLKIFVPILDQILVIKTNAQIMSQLTMLSS